MWRKIVAFLFDSVYQVVTWVWIAISISAFFFFASNKSQRGMIGSAVSLLAAVVVMLGLMAKKHFWDGESAAAPSLLPRPELSLEMAKVFFRPGKAPMVRLYIRNRGNATAHNIGFSGAQIMRSASDKRPLEPYPLGEPDTYPSLAANAGTQASTYDVTPLSTEEITDIMDGKRLFFQYTEGRYEDEAGNTYPFNVCLLYRPDVPGLEDDIAIAPREYWPKKNAPQDNPAMKDNEKPKTTNTTISRSIVNSPGASGNVLGDVSIHHHAPPPRLVTLAQANKMIAALRPHSGSTLAIMWLSNNNESFTYADQIARVFQSAGWKVEALGGFSGTAIGVGVVCEGKFPIAEAGAVVVAFREAELQITERTVPGWPEGNWRLIVGEKP